MRLYKHKKDGVKFAVRRVIFGLPICYIILKIIGFISLFLGYLVGEL